MPLPEFNSLGDLPEGVHRATIDDALARFGQGSLQRQLVTARLNRVYELAQKTGKLERFVIFGSYVTAKPDPNDVDNILVMRDDFSEQDYSEDRKKRCWFSIICARSENWARTSSGFALMWFC